MEMPGLIAHCVPEYQKSPNVMGVDMYKATTQGRRQQTWSGEVSKSNIAVNYWQILCQYFHEQSVESIEKK